MKRYTPQEAVRILTNAAKAYQENLVGRTFIVIYHDANTNTTTYRRLKFNPSNFQHLTGIRYADNISPKVFYAMCLNHRLSPTKLKFDPNGFTHMKLSVLPYLPELLYHKFWIGDSINNDIYINADYYIGDTKCVLSIGFREARESSPISLKRQSIREVVRRTNRVYGVLACKVSSGDEWACVYQDTPQIAEQLSSDEIYLKLTTELNIT